MRQSEHKRPSHTGGQGAYTLVEVVVALAIAGIMFAACMSGFSRGFSSVQSDRENSRAVQILLEKMELIRLYNWTQVTGGDTNTFVPTRFTAPFYPAASNGGFTYYGKVAITNANITPTYSNDLRTITVSLTWTNGRLSHFRSMSTLVSQYGLQNYIY
jgi:prepilin-type N-terminal cleavage/methylation domain-containing protein